MSVTVNEVVELPTIDSFSANRTEILSGWSVQFNWSTTGATSVAFRSYVVLGDPTDSSVSSDGSRTC